MMDPKYKECKNCGRSMLKEYKYCTECGAIYGKGEYKPGDWEFSCVYGPPPVKRVHQCTKCEYKWNTFSMVDHEHYCPECGGEAKTISKGD